jgi:hypothetical protein
VNKSIRKAVAASAVCAVAFAGGMTTDATAGERSAAKAAKAAKGLTKYAYKANVFGTKVVVNGVDLRTLKDAQAQQKCTRLLRGETVKGSALGTDGILPIGNDLIKVSPSTSRTKTYRVSDTYGVRGINTIADIKVGGEVQVGDTTVKTPVLVIKGLESVADSFNTAGKFGHAESFGFGGISLKVPEDYPGGAEVNELLDILDQNLPVNQIVNDVIDLLETVGVIEIPGLGSLALGNTSGRATAKDAYSNAYALKITVVNPADESRTILQLGRASSSIHAGAVGGVFRSTMSALDLSIGDLLNFGGVSTQNIPCAGTEGKVKTKKVAAANVLNLVNLSGVEYSYMGKQLSKKRVKGFVQTKIGSVSIPVADIEIDGITSRVDMKSKKPGKRVKRKVSTSVGALMIGGEKVTLAPGESHAFDGGVVRYQVIQNSDFYGTEARALKIELFEQNVTLTLAQSAGRVFFR